ncbi:MULTISPECIES: snapalysin [unclassified Streptomyces]|uniref:snapalysin n=1 Tax=unclassified Streptomyces TaxID=2593676 RepID=UPI00081E1EEA|nr:MULTISPECIES: snapalysin [unclassified Streptomyces]SCF86889.1 snapalysin [Streptomyces sp. MnatMP-M17]
MKHPKTAISAICGIGLAFATAFSVAPTATAADTATTASAGAGSYAAYAGSKAEAAANKAFFDAVLKSVAEKRAANPGVQAVTVVYNASNAPSFASQIASSTSIWNSAVTNVKLQAGSNADFTYYEGNDSRGSYASTDGHGRGYIFLDYRQNQQYNSTRVTAHETGHVLGLPDHYSGPCSELMSGGGPGTSCQNAQPNAAERSRVNQLWVNGLAAAMAKVS